MVKINQGRLVHPLFLMFFLVACSLIGVAVSQAADATLQWTPSMDPTVAGYKVYYQENSVAQPFQGTGAAQGASPINVNNASSITLTGLDSTQAYFFAVTSYNESGQEGVYSNIESAFNITPPAVSLIFPSNGSTVRGTVAVSAVAGDTTGVSSVGFYVNNVLQSTVTGSPYAFGWNTTSIANGTYTLEAKAYDAAGNVGTSSSVAVIVDNTATRSTTGENVALASNGAVATASSVYGSGYLASNVNLGNRAGVNWGNGGGWNGSTDTFPQWAQIAFNGQQTIDEIDVYTVQDNWQNPVTPTSTQTFSLYGITAFNLQYWNGTSWVYVPGGSVTGNNQVWRQFTFPSVTTNLIRVQVNASIDGFTRITDIEAYSPSNTTPPTVSLTAPSSGSTVSGTVAVTASASDNVGVTSVGFYLNNVLQSTVTSTPYTYSWNTTSLSNGSYTLVAMAYDAAGNIGTSSSVVVTVNNIAASTSTGVNVALQSNGGVATASSVYGSGYLASYANLGNRAGLNWGSGGGWNGSTATFPQWVQIAFNGQQTIDEIDVYTVQDNWQNPVTPTSTQTFSHYGITAFNVQYWNGTSWVTVPGGSITGNNLVWRKITFPSVTTNQIQVQVLGSADEWSRITDIEAYTAVSTGSDTTPPTVSLTAPSNGSTVSGTVTVTASASDNVGVTSVGFYVNNVLQSTVNSAPYTYSWNTTSLSNGSYTLVAMAYDAAGNVGTSSSVVVTVNNTTAGTSSGVNVALQSNGGVATASSVYGSGYLASYANMGNRAGLNWGSGGGWNGSTATFPQWVQIAFNGQQTIDEIDVYTVQDNWQNPVTPTLTQTFSHYGITAFNVQYWNGTSWVTVPGGSITGNNLVWRKITFPSVTTNQIQVQVLGSADEWSRITDIEAYTAVSTGSDTTPPTVSLTAPSNGSTVSGTVTVTASASDNVGVTSVGFYVNNVLQSTVTSAPYTYSWNTTSLSNGSYTLVAMAYDAAGNVGTSSSVVVTVNNTAAGTSSGVNVALQSNGGVATASSVYGSGYLASYANLGNRAGLNWGSGGGWNGSTATFPQWVQIAFNGQQTIDEIDVYTVQDNWQNPVTPTSTQTFSLYGITTFNVQYWNGTSWVTVPGGSITGNNLVWRKITFPSVTTNQIQVQVTGSVDDWSRITDIEAYTAGTAGSDTTPPTVLLTAPSSGSTVSGTVAVTASASDNLGVTSVGFYVNNVLQSTVTGSPYTYNWNTTSLTNGSYTLVAKATDTAGNVGTSSSVVVTVNNPSPSTITYLQGTIAQSAAQVPSMAFTKNNTAGSTILVAASCQIIQAGSPSGDVIITDSAGNTYAKVTSSYYEYKPAQNCWQYSGLFYTVNTQGTGSEKITVDINGYYAGSSASADASYCTVLGEEFISAGNTIFPDNAANGWTNGTYSTLGSTVTLTSSPITPSVNGDLIYSILFDDSSSNSFDTFTAGTGFNLLQSVSTGPIGYLADEYVLQSSESGISPAFGFFSPSGGGNVQQQWTIVSAAFSTAPNNLPVVSTQAMTGINATSAIANGIVVSSGSSSVSTEGFVYGTSSVSTNPGNVSPGSSGYANNISNTGSFSSGAFNVSATGLTANTTYYGRAYSQNKSGYSYGAETNFVSSTGE